MNEENLKPNGRGLNRIARATECSIKGLKAAWQNEAAFRQEVIMCALLIPLGIYLGETGLERALMISCLLLIIIIEIMNTAVEAVVDRIGIQRHILSGLAKDLGSAAVAISLLNCVLVWGFILVG
ncbi:diacylglycerol kinase [Desulfogranum japonicum]|uniref:diacylglycerol kinase n=1 Tax=Desulfogranum japonicum TaxID=231447 RepID=UPI0004121B50|nr:diacylglycerol kinase [Desulfogranum japonicum]